MLSRMRSFFRAVSRRSVFERDMDDELRFHIEQRIADLRRRGLSPQEAARRARVEFGSIEKHKDEARASFGLRLLDEMRGDVRFALRTFVRNRTFTATAVATLALGIGANTAIFSLFDALMLRSLPVRDPQALVQVGFRSDSGGSPFGSFSYAIARALDGERQIFSAAAGFNGGFTLRVGAPGSASRVPTPPGTGGGFV